MSGLLLQSRKDALAHRFCFTSIDIQPEHAAFRTGLSADLFEFFCGLIGGPVIDKHEAQFSPVIEKGDERIGAQPVRLIKTGDYDGNQGAPFRLPANVQRGAGIMQRKY